MFCITCGAQLDDNARFCPECGTPVSAGAAPMPTPQMPTPSVTQTPSQVQAGTSGYTGAWAAYGSPASAPADSDASSGSTTSTTASAGNTNVFSGYGTTAGGGYDGGGASAGTDFGSYGMAPGSTPSSPSGSKGSILSTLAGGVPFAGPRQGGASTGFSSSELIARPANIRIAAFLGVAAILLLVGRVFLRWSSTVQLLSMLMYAALAVMCVAQPQGYQRWVPFLAAAGPALGLFLDVQSYMQYGIYFNLNFLVNVIVPNVLLVAFYVCFYKACTGSFRDVAAGKRALTILAALLAVERVWLVIQILGPGYPVEYLVFLLSFHGAFICGVVGEAMLGTALLEARKTGRA